MRFRFGSLFLIAPLLPRGLIFCLAVSLYAQTASPSPQEVSLLEKCSLDDCLFLEHPRPPSLSKCFCRISNTNICLQILMTENTFDYYDVEETPSNRIDVTKDLLIGLFMRH